MTVEIKQLVIRAVVDSSRERTAAPGSNNPFMAPGPATFPTTSFTDQVQALDEQREAIVAACVRAVLRKLERSRER